MNILKLEPGFIIVHELFGDLTILQRDIENERYLVVVEEYKEIIKPQWIYFQEVEEVCEIKKCQIEGRATTTPPQGNQ